MSNKGPFMQAMEKYTKSIKTFISAQGFGHYSKPNGGIPKTDLDQSVQTSLGKADSALQGFTETDPTVPSWAKANNKPSYASDEISTTNQINKFATAEQLAQIGTNKNNILYAINNGVKNLGNFGSTGYKSDSGITYKFENNIITITGTKTTADCFQNLTAITLEKNTDYVLSGTRSGSPNISIYLYGVKNGSPVYIGDLGGEGSKTVNSGNNDSWFLRITIGGSVNDSVNSTFTNPMLSLKSVYDQDSSYQPPALLNYDLTRGLAELNAHPFLTIPINHNMIYRGQNLGASLTDAQHTALSSGNFTDLYLGDYWTKTVTIPAGTYTGGDGKSVEIPVQTNITLKAVIADFDTFYAGYASSYAAINTHHAAVIVTGFNNVVWNKTDTTAGGYVNSLIHKYLVGSVLPQLETWFGSAKVLSHQKLLTNAITGDAASGWAWSSQKISLLSENQMYGSKIWGNSKAANGGYEPGEAFKHLNVFNHIDANLLFGNKNIWLRDIASAGRAAGLSDGGHADSYVASHARVAPAALILLS